MSSDKRQRAISRGKRAKILMDDELLTEAFSLLEAAYVEAWRKSHSLDNAGREKLYVAVNIIGKVRQHLEHVAADGSLAEAELKTL